MPRTLLDDTHAVPVALLRPTRSLALRSTLPTLDTATVTLTPPVVGALPLVTLLALSDTPL